MAKPKTKKVRQPRKAKPKVTTDEPEVTTDEPEAPKVEEPKVEKPVKVVARAQVTLVGCASLTRHGRNYEKGRTFPVSGREKIDYFKQDPRFEVLELK